MWGLIVALIVVLPIRDAFGQDDERTIAIRGDRLSGFVLPIEPLAGNIRLEALKGWAWTVDDTKRLDLRGDVNIHVGGYYFTADRAMVWINRIPSADGVINQIAIVFNEARSPTSPAGMGATGKDLLVTGSTRGEVTLSISLLRQKRAARDDFIRGAESRLADHLKRLLVEKQTLRPLPDVDVPVSEVGYRPIPGGRVPEKELALPDEVALPSIEHATPWLRAPRSVVRFSADRIEVESGEEENIVTAIGSIVVEYISRDPDDDFKQMTLSAERAVIFTDPGRLDEITRAQVDTSAVRGIYLEGNVIASAEDGDYVVRAPKIYYDFRNDRAIMVDSVLRTHVRRLGVPLYARAGEMRQLAEDQWDASNVRVSTSEFYHPHLSLGAERIGIVRRPVGEDLDDRETYLDAEDITMRAGTTPFVYWPRLRGSIDNIPLKSIDVGTGDNDGLRIETKWNPFSLLGVEKPEHIEADLKIDGFTKRGPAAGLELEYDYGVSEGAVDLYGLYDDGVDRTSTGRDVEYEDDFRGVALAEHKTRLSRDWDLQTQASFISDPTFISAWREDDFRERREFESSIYLRYQRNNTAFSVLTAYQFNEFISNNYLLASRQYTVDRLPELSYRRYGDAIFDDRVTYTSETRASRVRLAFEKSTPAELGVRGRAWGIDEDQRIDQMLRQRGLDSRYVSRFDTRHEFALPTKGGIFDLTPFVVARLTAYDDDFDEYSVDSDSARVFGAMGLRANTQFQRVYDGVESRLFDLHRLRHIIEPSMTLWYGYSDVSQDDLPEYDVDVESLATGAAVRLGVRNTFQTQRGGPGRWRSVDVFTLDTDLVLNSNDADSESPAAQFFDYRPEYSQFGHHIYSRGVWLLSDAFSLAGEGRFDLDESAVARGSIGAELRHSPILVSFIEYRYLDASDNELLGLGWNYRLTPKYEISLRPQWDIREDDFRAVSVRITRSFPDFDFIVRVKYDRIRDETTFAASLDLVTF